MFNISNSVRLIGRLGQDPEIKTLDNGKKMARISLATNERYRNAEGEKVERTTWHNLVAWGPQAEFARKIFTQGQRGFSGR